MKCCASTDVGAWTKWLTFEPDLDHSPDAGTGFRSPIAYALQQWNYITSGKSHAHRSSNAWFWGVERPLSEVNALYRVCTSSNECICLWSLGVSDDDDDDDDGKSYFLVHIRLLNQIHETNIYLALAACQYVLTYIYYVFRCLINLPPQSGRFTQWCFPSTCIC